MAQSTSSNALKSLYQNLASVMHCAREPLLLTLATMLARGHLLLEDVPGLGKTMLARSLARSVDLRFHRLQCTPDLMPSDVTGISVYSSEDDSFHFMPGPIFTNVLLADEINRATPRTQSALLEAMAEGTVSMDRETHDLPDPFLVIATQNPVEFGGTYRLPEAQLDRFFMRISLGYPTAEQEQQIMLDQQSGHPMDRLEPVIDADTLRQLQTRCQRVPISQPMVAYINHLVRATREHESVTLGASPRGSLALMQASRAMAVLTGHGRVVPEVVQRLLEPVLAHRLVFRDPQLERAANREAFWADIRQQVPVPDHPDTPARKQASA